MRPAKYAVRHQMVRKAAAVGTYSCDRWRSVVGDPIKLAFRSIQWHAGWATGEPFGSAVRRAAPSTPVMGSVCPAALVAGVSRALAADPATAPKRRDLRRPVR